MKFEQRYLEKNVNVSTTSQWREVFRLGTWLLAIVFVVYFVLGFIAEKIVERLPYNVEQALAQGFISQLDKEDFPQTRDYLQKVLDRLVISAHGLPPFSYKIYIIDEDTINAVALPAGNIFIFRGLLEHLKTENELAMVLAHELGHYAHRDHLRGLGRGLVVMTISGLMGFSGDAMGFIFPSIQVFELKLSRTQESSADDYGVDLVAKAYGHTGGVLSVFDALESYQKKNKRIEFFSSHPDTIWRKQFLERQMQSKQYSQQVPSPIASPGYLPFPGEPIVKKEKSIKK